MVGFAACIWVAMHNKRTQIMVALHPRGALALTDHFGPGCREKNLESKSQGIKTK